jgi:ankyrin repeat protein
MNNDNPLIEACKQNDLGRVKELLDQGVDPNLQDRSRKTSLIYASWFGYIDVVRLLLDRGADPNLQNGRGNTAFIYASVDGHIDVVKLLEAACWNRNIAKPLEDLDIFPEGLIREHLTV